MVSLPNRQRNLTSYSHVFANPGRFARVPDELDLAWPGGALVVCFQG